MLDILAASLVPYFSKCIVDELSLNLASSFGFALLMLGLFWTLEKVAEHLQEIFFFPVINETTRDMTRDVVEHIHTIPLKTYQTLSVPEIISCIKRISQSSRNFFRVLFLLILPSIGKLLIATFVTIKLGLFGAALIPIFLLCFFTLYKGAQWYVRAREQAWQLSDKVTMRINDSIANTKITRPFHEFEMNSLQEILKQEAILWYKTNTRIHLVHAMIGIILGITLTTLLYSAILAIKQHSLSIGDFVMLKGQLIAAFLPFKKLSLEFRQLAEATIDISKIIRLLEIPKENKAIILTTPSSQTGIQFRNLSFEYDHESPIFEDLSFNIPSGEKVVITGENGGGKSTLVSLLGGLHKPNRGSILIHGIELQQYSEASLSKTIHCIPQDLRLFNLSLYENLTYGLRNISKAQLEYAIEATGLVSIINQLNAGLNTPIGEMGIRLSGGEKQRVALARALLINPSILVLDETLHSLTVETERKLLLCLFKQIETVILVSHRKSLFPLMDRILKIQNGKLLQMAAEASEGTEHQDREAMAEDVV